jgi:hypothetical protein
VGEGAGGRRFRRTAFKKTARGRRREDCASWAREDEQEATTGTYRRAPHAKTAAAKLPSAPDGRARRALAQAAGAGPPRFRPARGEGEIAGRGRGREHGGWAANAWPAHDERKGEGEEGLGWAVASTSRPTRGEGARGPREKGGGRQMGRRRGMPTQGREGRRGREKEMVFFHFNHFF